MWRCDIMCERLVAIFSWFSTCPIWAIKNTECHQAFAPDRPFSIFKANYSPKHVLSRLFRGFLGNIVQEASQIKAVVTHVLKKFQQLEKSYVNKATIFFLPVQNYEYCECFKEYQLLPMTHCRKLPLKHNLLVVHCIANCLKLPPWPLKGALLCCITSPQYVIFLSKMSSSRGRASSSIW